MIADIEKKWLVKSDNKIIGPYSFEQLEDLLSRRQIALIDEVRVMDQRWLYIREIPELKDMVEKVRHELDKKSEETRTFQTIAMTQSGVLNQTRTGESSNTELLQSASQFTDVTVETQDIEFKEIETKNLEFKSKKNILQFVSATDPNIQTELDKSKKKVWLAIPVVFVALVIVFLSYYFYKKINQEKFEKNQITKVRKFVINGSDLKAIAAFQKLSDQLQSTVLPDLLPLFPKLEAEGLIQLDEAIQKILKKPYLTMMQKSEIQLIQFHKAVSLNKYKEAKAYLLQARDFDPSSDIVKENESIMSYLDGKHSVSSTQFSDLFNSTNNGRYLLGYTLNHFKKNDITDIDLIEKIERYLSIRNEYKKELVLCQLILALKINNISAAGGFFTDFIETPLKLSSNFKLPGLVYDKIYKFDQLASEYSQFKTLLNSKMSGLMDLYLTLENNEGYSAQKIYDKIQDQLTKSEKANAQIAINSILNRYSENLAIEKTVNSADLNVSSQFILLKSKIENKNTDFLKNAEFLKKQKNIISFWTDLLILGDRDKMKLKYFLQNNAIKVEDFIPYIEAKERLE